MGNRDAETAISTKPNIIVLPNPNLANIFGTKGVTKAITKKYAVELAPIQISLFH